MPKPTQPTAARIPLRPISPEGMALLRQLWADETPDTTARQDFVSKPSRFVGIKRGLPDFTSR